MENQIVPPKNQTEDNGLKGVTIKEEVIDPEYETNGQTIISDNSFNTSKESTLLNNCLNPLINDKNVREFVVTEVGKTSSSLRVVYKNKTDLKPKVELKCNIKGCRFVALNKTQLSSHLRCDHKSSKTSLKQLYICNECQYTTSSVNLLFSHKDRIHQTFSKSLFEAKVKTEVTTEPELTQELSKDSILDPLPSKQDFSLRRRRRRRNKEFIIDKTISLTNDEMKYNFQFTDDTIQTLDKIKFKSKNLIPKNVTKLLETPQIEIKSKILLNYFNRCLKTNQIYE